MRYMTRKPPHVFDRDTEWHALVDFAVDARAQPLLGVVTGRRRQGKTYLLSALTEVLGGFYFQAVEATEAESLRMLGDAVARHVRAPAPYAFADWDAVLETLFGLDRDGPSLVVLDEFSYLTRASPALPSLVRRHLDQFASSRKPANRTRLMLCGSAMSVMGTLLSGNAPLRGRAGLELLIRPLLYREAAKFWGAADSRLAVLLNAVVGGTPAYRREFVRDDIPKNLRDFDAWVQRAVLSSHMPLFREARYLLAEEADIRDAALYHSVLAAIAEGNATRGRIASYIGRKSGDISHPLTVLEDSGFIEREADAFRSGRSSFRIAEPLINFYQAVMRPAWHRLELGQVSSVWEDSRPRFTSQVVGPQFEALCRQHALVEGARLFGRTPGEVTAGVAVDPANRSRIDVDVVVFAPAVPGEPQQIIALGEVKWGEELGERHLARLRRARDVLSVRGFDIDETVLALYGGGGFERRLRSSTENVVLVDLDRLYAD
jgi:uncharacterized protein